MWIVIVGLVFAFLGFVALNRYNSYVPPEPTSAKKESMDILSPAGTFRIVATDHCSLQLERVVEKEHGIYFPPRWCKVTVSGDAPYSPGHYLNYFECYDERMAEQFIKKILDREAAEAERERTRDAKSAAFKEAHPTREIPPFKDISE